MVHNMLSRKVTELRNDEPIDGTVLMYTVRNW